MYQTIAAAAPEISATANRPLRSWARFTGSSFAAVGRRNSADAFTPAAFAAQSDAGVALRGARAFHGCHGRGVALDHVDWGAHDVLRVGAAPPSGTARPHSLDSADRIGDNDFARRPPHRPIRRQSRRLLERHRDGARLDRRL